MFLINLIDCVCWIFIRIREKLRFHLSEMFKFTTAKKYRLRRDEWIELAIITSWTHVLAADSVKFAHHHRHIVCLQRSDTRSRAPGENEKSYRKRVKLEAAAAAHSTQFKSVSHARVNSCESDAARHSECGEKRRKTCWKVTSSFVGGARSCCRSPVFHLFFFVSCDSGIKPHRLIIVVSSIQWAMTTKSKHRKKISENVIKTWNTRWKSSYIHDSGYDEHFRFS